MEPVSLDVGPAAASELGSLADLCARGLPAAPPAYFAARFAQDSRILPGGLLVARDRGRVVAGVTAFRFRMRFGEAVVPCGGIGNVVTDPDWQGRGLAHRLLERAHALVASAGLPLTVLTTQIPDFYAPLGYVGLDRSETDGLRLTPAGDRPAVPVRPFDRERDLGALARLHAGHDRRFVGPLERREADWPASWAWTPFHPREDFALALVAGDPPRAYLRCAVTADRSLGYVIEFAAEERAAAETDALASALVSRLFALGVPAVRSITACRDLTAALTGRAAVASASSNPHLMVRLDDFPGALAALVPELSRRAAAADAPDEAVVLTCGDRSARVVVHAGRVAVGPGDPVGPGTPHAVMAPGEWIASLFGQRRFSSQAFARRSHLTELQINVLDVLFPRRDLVFWESDAF